MVRISNVHHDCRANARIVIISLLKARVTTANSLTLWLFRQYELERGTRRDKQTSSNCMEKTIVSTSEDKDEQVRCSQHHILLSHYTYILTHDHLNVNDLVRIRKRYVILNLLMFPGNLP